MPYTQVNSCSKTALLVALTVVIAVVSSITYISVMRWSLREHSIAQVEKQGCQYLGRILGTTDVIVMKCDGEIKLEEHKE